MDDDFDSGLEFSDSMDSSSDMGDFDVGSFMDETPEVPEMEDFRDFGGFEEDSFDVGSFMDESAMDLPEPVEDIPSVENVPPEVLEEYEPEAEIEEPEEFEASDDYPVEIQAEQPTEFETPAELEPVEDVPTEEEIPEEPVEETAEDVDEEAEPIESEPAEPAFDEGVYADEPVEEMPMDEIPVEAEPTDDEPVEFEKPAADDEPAEFEKPAAEDVPVEFEEPAVDDEPVEFEEPVVDDELAEFEEPAADDEPTEFEESAADDELAEFEEPTAHDEPAEFEELVVDDVPTELEEPTEDDIPDESEPEEDIPDETEPAEDIPEEDESGDFDVADAQSVDYAPTEVAPVEHDTVEATSQDIAPNEENPEVEEASEDLPVEQMDNATPPSSPPSGPPNGPTDVPPDGPPDGPNETAEEKHYDTLYDYLCDHNYSREDYDTYSKDPEWQRLNNEYLIQNGREPIDYSATDTDLNVPDVQNEIPEEVPAEEISAEMEPIGVDTTESVPDAVLPVTVETVDTAAAVETEMPERELDEFETMGAMDDADFYESGSFYTQGINEYGYTGTCGETSVANTMNRVLGTNEYTENKVLDVAVQEGLCDTSSFEDSGGTTTKQFMELYEHMNEACGSQLDVELTEHSNVLSMEEAAQRLEDGCTLNVAVDSATLWDEPDPMGAPAVDSRATDHWITVTGVQRDGDGSILGFDIIDSGGGVSYVDADKYQAMCYGTDDLELTDPTCIVVSKADGVADVPAAEAEPARLDETQTFNKDDELYEQFESEPEDSDQSFSLLREIYKIFKQ